LNILVHQTFSTFASTGNNTAMMLVNDVSYSQ